ncbi:AmmeMemoRadiSam system protein B [Chloroflexota bacterium]
MAGVVFGCIVPHPPLLVPEIGGGREVEISATIQSMQQLTRKLAEKRPETVIVISPHGQSLYDSMGIATSKSIQGSMRRWGAWNADHDFENDLDFVAELEKEARASGIPLEPIDDNKGYQLDHGVMVPISYLIDGMRDVPLVPLTFCWLPLTVHFSYGQAIGRVAERLNKRVVVIASGDLSHRLIPDAPAGYDPIGQVFDKKLTEAVASYDVSGILNLDSGLIERAGECGLRSIVILLGALDGLYVKPMVLSYEGPFGVGYMVAYFEVETG